MSTPAYQVVALGGNIGIKPLQLLKAPLVAQVYRWGAQPYMKYSGHPIILGQSQIAYNWRFFYPSNGKIPGSPIPNSGQLLPRPL